MQFPLTTILCMLGICVCIDIIFRVFNIHVSWWNARLRPGGDEKGVTHEDTVPGQSKTPSDS